MKNKGARIMHSFFSQNFRTVVALAVNVVQVSFLKMSEEGPVARDETIIRVSWIGKLGIDGINNTLSINLYQ